MFLRVGECGMADFGAIPSNSHWGFSRHPPFKSISLHQGLGGSLVSAVDEDGNEVAGISLPPMAVPLATHTGWTQRHRDVGGETWLFMSAGGNVPFSANRSQRETKAGPRLSIAERYGSKES